MVTLKCDRCKQAATRLWEVQLLFKELAVGETHDGEVGKARGEVCEPCSDELDQLLAKECGQPDPLKKKTTK